MNLRVASRMSGPLKATYLKVFQSVSRVRAATKVALRCRAEVAHGSSTGRNDEAQAHSGMQIANPAKFWTRK